MTDMSALKCGLNRPKLYSETQITNYSFCSCGKE